MASSLIKRLAALFGASCAALLLAVPAAAPGHADRAVLESPADECPTPPNYPGNIGFEGRHYRVHVPSGVPAGAPLVVAIHGGYDSPESVEAAWGWNALADQHKFIVVYPRGTKKECKTDGSPGWGWNADAADVTHIKNVVNAVATQYGVNRDRVHLTGHSNGGQMASRAACTAPEVFASGAVYAPAPPPTGCNPARAVSWGVFASASDPIVLEPIAYGHVMYWSWENRPCQNEQPGGGTDIKDSRHWDCESGTEVLWRVYNGGSHTWPTGARRTEMMNRMWQLFQDNPRP
ncbi:alpha/beta hydrolase family esterase [Nocardia salmonicida]|uniref:alpha/beta hydrolase family esterase n=1 Tax=Nocardia salmonicida TaxID=53431 RepID=UPI0007A5196C|nr:PHB depolymerase family esterase [Nocardia salmonicida]